VAGSEVGAAAQLVTDQAAVTAKAAYIRDDQTILTIAGTMPVVSLATSIRNAVGMAAANLDTQIDALPTAAENATATWSKTLTDLDALGATTVGKWFRTVLAGITRSRHMENLRANGVEVREVVMSFDDVTAADEVFLSGNFSKVMPVTAFEDRQYQVGPVTKRVRQLYWDWARSAA
jgi:hypothetical protein